MVSDFAVFNSILTLQSDPMLMAPPAPILATPTPDLEVDSEPLALATLRKTLGNYEANWTSGEQRDGVLAVVNADTDVLAVLATGAGKTMLVILPALMEVHQITVLVLPLKSLLMDYQRKLQAMKIPFQVYTPSTPATGQHNLVLATVESARTPGFKQNLGQVNQSIPVRRIIFDEAQYALTSEDFRESLRDLQELRFLPVPMVLLSGTVPPTSEPALVKAFGLDANYTCIRTRTDRPELAYHLCQPVKSDRDMLFQVDSIISLHTPDLEKQDRILIFVPFKAVGDEMARHLKVEFYHGNRETSDEDKVSKS